MTGLEGVQVRAPSRARRPRIDPTPFLLITPAQLLLVALILLPTIYVGWLSLHRATFGTDPAFVGLANWQALLGDRVFWQAAKNTFFVVLAVVYGELALGLSLALLASGWMPGKKIFIALLIAPYAINEVSAVTMWRYVLEPDIGMVSWTLVQLGIGQLDWSADPNDALALAALLGIWTHTPFTFLILYAALQGVPAELQEAARVDGAGAWREFRAVTLPGLRNEMVVALTLTTITALRSFDLIYNTTQGGPGGVTRVPSVLIYQNAFRNGKVGLACAIAVILTLLIFAVAWAIGRVAERGDDA